MKNSVKLALYRLCEAYVDKRIQSCRQAIDAAQQSANAETKSSSGDKYETGRAMMQLEIEKNSVQLAEALKLKQTLMKTDVAKASTSVELGSVVTTDRGAFFIAISLGQLKLHGREYIVIAPTSPLGAQFMGATVGDHIDFRNQSYVIQEVE